MSEYQTTKISKAELEAAHASGLSKWVINGHGWCYEITNVLDYMNFFELDDFNFVKAVRFESKNYKPLYDKVYVLYWNGCIDSFHVRGNRLTDKPTGSDPVIVGSNPACPAKD